MSWQEYSGWGVQSFSQNLYHDSSAISQWVFDTYEEKHEVMWVISKIYILL